VKKRKLKNTKEEKIKKVFATAVKKSSLTASVVPVDL